MLYKMKLKNTPNQSFVLNNIIIDGVSRAFRVDLSYRELCGYWTMSLYDQYTQEQIVSEMPLVTGLFLDRAGNMLDQMKYLNLGQIGIFPETDNTTDYPNDVNIETDFALFWRYDES